MHLKLSKLTDRCVLFCKMYLKLSKLSDRCVLICKMYIKLSKLTDGLPSTGLHLYKFCTVIIQRQMKFKLLKLRWQYYWCNKPIIYINSSSNLNLFLREMCSDWKNDRAWVKLETSYLFLLNCGCNQPIVSLI